VDKVPTPAATHINRPVTALYQSTAVRIIKAKQKKTQCHI